MDSIAHILVVDDDDRLRTLLERYLSQQNFVVSVADNADQALALSKGYQFDMAVVDVMMPGMSGTDLTPKLPCPVLLLTALGEAEDRIKGLEAGADDYLAKPFEAKELLLRIQAILRRTKKASAAHIVKFQNYEFNLENGNLSQGNQIISLSENERTLINLFAQNKNNDISRQTIATSLGIEERSVDVQITRLRKKLTGVQIQSIRGVGYRLVG